MKIASLHQQATVLSSYISDNGLLQLVFSRHLLKHFKLRPPWKKWSLCHQLAPLGVPNNEFVAGFTGLIPSRLPWSHFLQYMCAQFSVAVLRF